MTVGPGARALAAGRRRGTVGSVPSAPGREPQRTHTARAHTPLTSKDTHGACAHSAHAQGHTRRLCTLRSRPRTHTAHTHTPLTPKDTHGTYAHSAHAHVRALPKAGGVPCQALALKLCQVDEHGMKHGTAITWDE